MRNEILIDLLGVTAFLASLVLLGSGITPSAVNLLRSVEWIPEETYVTMGVAAGLTAISLVSWYGLRKRIVT